MQIAYVVAESLAEQSGVSIKVRSQVRRWEAGGHKVNMFDLSEVPASDRAGWRWLRWSNELCRRALLCEPDVVYIRFTTWVPALSRLARSYPVVLEINGDDLTELSTRRLPYRWYHRVVRRMAFHSCIGIVVPTHELAASPRVGRLARQVLVVANGIDLDTLPTSSPSVVDEPRLVFTYTSATDWPGVDLVLELAELMPETPIDIIGPVPEGALPLNVSAHGYLSGKAYDEVLSRATVGIGSLAMFRAGLNEGSTLKVRGYLAAGLPVILGYHDTDFPQGAPFLLEIPNRADGVRSSIREIRSFVAAQRPPVPRSEIAHLDSSVKEELRLDFLAHAAATRAPRLAL